MTDLRKILQLPLTKLKVILALLSKSGYIEITSKSALRRSPRRCGRTASGAQPGELRDQEVLRSEQARDDAAVRREDVRAAAASS